MNETNQSLKRNQRARNKERMTNTEGSEGRDMGTRGDKSTTLSPEVVVEGKERMLPHTLQHTLWLPKALLAILSPETRHTMCHSTLYAQTGSDLSTISNT